MKNLKTVETKGRLVLTTNQIATAYEVEPQIITNNFNRNKAKYIEGKHYICLKGDDKKEFIKKNQNDFSCFSKARAIYLWTEKGALLHAKSLNTDKAWEVYDYLVDHYFRSQEKMEIVPVDTKVKKLEEKMPAMKNPIQCLRILLQVAEENGIKVDSYPFKSVNSVLKNQHIGVRTNMLLEKVVYEIAWELSHAFIHYDAEDLITGPLTKDYNEQATRAADMIISVLNARN